MATIKTRICNKCGRQIEYGDRFPGLSYEDKIGYGSKYDGCRIELDLCTDCLDWLIDVCVIDPTDDENIDFLGECGDEDVCRTCGVEDCDERAR